MNGELYQACQLTIAVRSALSGKAFSYQGTAYEKTLRFSFLDGAIVQNAQAWYLGLRQRALEDVKLLSPVTVNDRNLLGFSNGTDIRITCFYQDGAVTYWRALWEFDSTQKGWHIEYREARCDSASCVRPCFEDHTDSFRAVLTEIQDLAERLDEPHFADNCFAQARRILTEGSQQKPFPIDLPERNTRLFCAAMSAWVFGGMGSWNDSPPYEAHQKGLGKEYERLSAELHRQIMLAVLFAVNE